MNFYQLQNERWCYSFNDKGIVGEKNKTKQNKTKKTLSTEFFCNKRNPPPPPNERSRRHNFHFCFVFQLRPVIIPHEALPPLLPSLLAVNFSKHPLYNLLVTTDPPLFSVENPLMAIQ